MNFLNPLIEFYADNHSYWKGEEKLNSVGSWIKAFTKNFDSNYWLTWKTLEKIIPDEFSKLKDKHGYNASADKIFKPLFKKINIGKFAKERELLSWQWNKKGTVSRTKGSIFHDKMEQDEYKTGYSTNPFDKKDYSVIWQAKTYDNESLVDDLSKLKDGCYLELLVFHLRIKTAGQTDKAFIETIDETRYVDVLDFKTNEERPKTSDRQRWEYPLQHLQNCDHVKYSFQISFYAWMLEQFGFKVRNLAYIWHKDYDPKKYEIIQVPYLKKEIEDAIEFWTFK